MKEGHSSLTATAVAFARGVGVNERQRDVMAEVFVKGPLGLTLSALSSSQLARLALRPVLRVATVGLVDHMTLRMLAIDREVLSAIAGGAEQVVVLGAGLDDRAWRIAELADLPVFEVDHPATQETKKTRAAALASTPLHTFVPVDFARDDLDSALAAAGHDAAKPTVWICEGVSMYLPRTALEQTLRTVRARSALASVLLMSYLTRGIERSVLAPIIQAAFRTIGEPLVGAIDPPALARLLVKHDFSVVRDENSLDWARSFRTSRLLRASFHDERLVTAAASAGISHQPATVPATSMQTPPDKAETAQADSVPLDAAVETAAVEPETVEHKTAEPKTVDPAPLRGEEPDLPPKRPPTLTTKQKRSLRKLAHDLIPVVQVGKNGVTDDVLAATDQALTDHELIKIRIQEGCPTHRKEVGALLENPLGAHEVGLVGRICMLYRRHPSEPSIRV